jgi:hypothetical protein
MNEASSIRSNRSFEQMSLTSPPSGGKCNFLRISPFPSSLCQPCSDCCRRSSSSSSTGGHDNYFAFLDRIRIRRIGWVQKALSLFGISSKRENDYYEPLLDAEREAVSDLLHFLENRNQIVITSLSAHLQAPLLEF